mgnify:CR=1 FL=1
MIWKVLEGKALKEMLAQAREMKRIVLASRERSDLELLATGAYSPLEGFMTREEYRGVLEDMRLPSGAIWSLPITLAVSTAEARSLREGERVALADEDGTILGCLEVQDRFRYDREGEARAVYRTTDPEHPGVARLLGQKEVYLGGPVWLLQRPEHPFPAYHFDPPQVREMIRERGWKRVVGFQTRNPVHRAHEYLQKCALEMADGLLLHPLVGDTKGDDVPAEVRMRCYEVLMENYYPRERVILAVFPGAMRYAGPREAVFHALVRKNYGCTHFIVGRDHAGVGSYYGPFDAHRLLEQFRPEELGIQILYFDQAFYCRACAGMASEKTCPHGAEERLILSGTRVREMLRRGEMLPPEFTRPEVARVLAEAFRLQETRSVK